MLKTPLVSAKRDSRTSLHYDLPEQSSNDYNQTSVNYVIAFTLSIKVIFSTYALLTDSNSDPQLKTWLCAALISDIVCIAVCARRYRQMAKQAAESLDLENFSSRNDLAGSSGGSREAALISYIERFNTCFYLALLVWGHQLYYGSCTTCFGQSNTSVADLVTIYLYIGYFSTGYLLLKVVLSRFTDDDIPEVNYPAPAWLAALPVIFYSTQLNRPHECQICLSEYREGDQLLEIPCGSKHCFHKNCAEKWFKMNDNCLMCREKVGADSQSTTMASIELRSLSVLRSGHRSSTMPGASGKSMISS